MYRATFQGVGLWSCGGAPCSKEGELQGEVHSDPLHHGVAHEDMDIITGHADLSPTRCAVPSCQRVFHQDTSPAQVAAHFC